ncbi:c-type cytochrome [Ruegeria sp. 2205SS24-7]|uniref:c-type cytochrome n=1 Tax=Ruegeria discodermiae TaxID=3064389 RepID=UPI002741EC57|nr:c-type cytochrome [Ruegeria sp. 2205SS24-7]MDP5219093.1 c-type cytochrome [Ruegeria sp. 2205SS24-7]
MRRLLSSLFLCLALPATAQEFTTYKGHGGPIMGLVVTRDGRLASASFDNSVGVWTGQSPRWLEGHDAAVTAIAEDREGVLVTGGDDFAVWHWGAAPRKIGQHKGKVTSLAASPDGSVLAAGSWDGDIVLWPLHEGAPETLPFPGAGVNAVAYSADGAQLFAATSKGDLLRYDMASRDTARPLVRHGFGINRLVVGDGWLAYGAVDGVTRVIDAETGAQMADFTLDRRPILSMAHHAQTGQLAIGDGEGHIMMVDTKEWRITHDFRAMRQGPVWALAFSTDGAVIHAGGIDDVIYAWPVALLDSYDPAGGNTRSFLRDVATMSNGERQFMRKCSICHSLEPKPSRKAGPTLHGVFGRKAGVVPGYRYSPTLDGSAIIWTDTTIDALFDQGPDHYIPGSKMPMQVIAEEQDRADLIAFLRQATKED